MITVSAGAKAFLDLAPHARVPGDPWRPRARLATRLVPGVLHPVVRAPGAAPGRGRGDGRRRVRGASRDVGMLVAVPIPDEAELDPAAIDEALVDGTGRGGCDGDRGAAVTPFVLGRIAAVTAGGSIPANLALAERNAAVAGEVAVAVSRLDPDGR